MGMFTSTMISKLTSVTLLLALSTPFAAAVKCDFCAERCEPRYLVDCGMGAKCELQKKKNRAARCCENTFPGKGGEIGTCINRHPTGTMVCRACIQAWVPGTTPPPKMTLKKRDFPDLPSSPASTSDASAIGNEA